MCDRETDAQRQAEGRAGEEHAPTAGRARRQPGGSCTRVRNQPDLPQFGGAFGTQRVNRQHRADRQGLHVEPWRLLKDD
jgi:hypothetical protein